MGSIVAILAAAAAAGPWPHLGLGSFWWRLPVIVVGLLFARRWRLRRWQVPVAACAAIAAVFVDALVPKVTDAVDASREASRGAVSVSVQLGLEAQQPELRTLLYGTGGEAVPETAFDSAEAISGRVPLPLSALILADERGTPVAWCGPSPRLPLRLRPLGGRAVVAEPGVGSVWLWWREPVFESGRLVGAILAGLEVPEDGRRSLLGAWGGRAGTVRPRLDGGVPLVVGSGEVAMGIETTPSRPIWWSSAGWSLALAAALLATTCPLRACLALLLATGFAVTLVGWGGTGWWLVLVLAGVALVLELLPRTAVVGGVAVIAVFGMGWVQPAVVSEIGLAVTPARLLTPGVQVIMLVLLWLFVLRSVARCVPRFHWLAGVVAWALLAIAVSTAVPLLLGLGAAAVAAAGLPRRSVALAALAGAALLTASGDASRRSELVSITETTVARLENVEAPARSFLLSLPETALEGVARLESREQTVVLGRLVRWLRFGDVVPGGTLAMISPEGKAAGTWGESSFITGDPPGEVASRELPSGWRIVIQMPPPPHRILAALVARRIGVPVAAFDRSGSAVARGAIFRPMTPTVVGGALAAGRSWGRVGVGEGEFGCYLRVRGDVIIAVPWVRPPFAEWLLLVAALALWPAAPVAAWEFRARLATWWRERRSFAGRVRLVTAAATVLPVMLLGQFLPRQWTRQRDQVRLEFARSVSQTLAAPNWEIEVGWLVREAGAIVAVYRGGAIELASRSDLVATGAVPGLPPAAAYTRAVRGWREPLVLGEDSVSVFAPQRWGDDAVVAAALDLPIGPYGGSPTPPEWFIITALWAMALGLVVAEQLGGRVVRPLRSLLHAAGRVERGEDVGELEAGDDEEVATLVRAFGTMARTVHTREDELRQEKDLLSEVLGTLSAAVMVTSRSGHVQLANPAAKALLSGSESLAPVASSFGFSSAELLQRAEAGEWLGEPVHPLSYPDQSWRVTALPLPPDNERVLVVMEDLSEVARAERLASLAELARIVAHEVKNPLTPIRLWAEELQAAVQSGGDKVVEVARTAAEQILERTEHLREVAQGFSNLVALEHWEAEPVPVAELAEKVAGEYGVLASRGIEVRQAGNREGVVYADARWLKRALRHLLDNSAKALGDRAGTIEIDVDGDENEVRLAVRDTGGGVEPDHLGRLFEPHFSTTSRGTGLGLAVVQRVATRASGRAEANNLAQGLEVRLIFPARPVQ